MRQKTKEQLEKEENEKNEAYILLLSQGKGSVFGKSSKFYTDVKSIMRAGMEFDYRGGTKDKVKYSPVIKNVGHKIVRIYFETKEKDCTIGEQVIKTVLYD